MILNFAAQSKKMDFLKTLRIEANNKGVSTGVSWFSSKGETLMSSESFKQFLAKIEQDAGLSQELRTASGEFGMPVEALAAFAAGKGYSFTAEDVSTAPSTGELSEASLDAVVGGGIPPEPEMPSPLSTFRGLSGNLMVKFH